LAAGCVGPAPSPHVESTAARITGVENAIAFQIEAGPLDVAGDDPELLTLAHATRLSLESNPEIQAALARVRSAEADAQQARLLPNPIVTVIFRGRFGGTPIFTPSLSEDLIGILERPRRASAADHRLRAAAGEALAAVITSLSDVQEKYFEVQSADAQLAVLSGRRKLLEQLLDMARARLKGGEGIGLDVTAIEAQILNLDTDITLKEIDRHEFRLTLARLIGRPSGRTDWKVTSWDSPARVASPQRDWIAAALESRPEIQSRRWELAALADQVALANLAPWEGLTIGVEAEHDVEWSVGPAVSTPLPIFDTGRAKRDKAIADVIEARHKFTQTRRQVIEEVRKAYDTFASTQAVLARTRDELMPLEEKRRQQAEAAYRAGESDLTTVLVAEEELQDAKTKLVDLEQKTSVAFVRLQRAVGGPGLATKVESGSRAATQPVIK
jgi:cobalt-zinc-cadmium efflux system outer membrane protein